MVVETEDGYKGTGIPVKLSRTPGRITHRAPRFGEHTREILLAHGYDENEVQALLDEDVVITAV
jgi:crotonobetainyl-CoA:carnitine CoA-transferase CaiB-like acyl-CoA transferase